MGSKVNRCVSVLCPRAEEYLIRKTPSQYIPFKGKFPLMSGGEQRMFRNEMYKHADTIDLSLRFQHLTDLGCQMADLEKSFIIYLKLREKFDSFLDLSDSEKADLLVDWMDRSCVTDTYFNIKIRPEYEIGGTKGGEF